MAKKSSKTPRRTSPSKTHGVINGAGEIVEQPIVSTIRENYMPYAMSVILSRAIPEIDGFKPSHRKLLYMMYKMGLLNGGRTKSANIVGATMKLNPHGDSAIYDTMVRLSRGYEALLHPYVDSKGNFGKFYSRDMAWAASRYTEAKLDADDRVPHYDIEFVYGGYEYEFEINAKTGAIIEFDRELEDKKPQVDTSKFISADAAKKAALAHAGLTEAQVTELEAELDTDSLTAHYDVDFKCGGYEYEYKINAKSGKVISFEKERD